MQGILSDNCIEAHARVIIAILTGPEWQDLWARLNIQFRTFRDVGLAADSADSVVWQFCQDQQMALITANRNQDGPDSLEETIRTQNTPESLPVFTIGDADEVFHARAYAERVAERLLESLLIIDGLRGAGRIWLP